MNPEEIVESFANLNKDFTKEELKYLEIYSGVKGLIEKGKYTSESIKTIVDGLKYLRENKPFYEEIRKSSRK